MPRRGSCAYSPNRWERTARYSDTAPGLIQVYVVHTGTPGATAVWFAAPKPACMTGTWISDTCPFPIASGDSQTGISVDYGACLSSPIHVVTISYLTQGMTPPDCPYEILPHPRRTALSLLDCNSNYHPGYPSTTYINSNLACTCNVRRNPATLREPDEPRFWRHHGNNVLCDRERRQRNAVLVAIRVRPVVHGQGRTRASATRRLMSPSTVQASPTARITIASAYRRTAGRASMVTVWKLPASLSWA